MKRTKIVATISDKRCEPDFLKQLIEAGVNVVRLNTAHLDHESALYIIKNVRSVDDKVAILIDTKGPEVRTSRYGEEISTEEGELITVVGNPEGKSGNHILYVSYPHLTRDIPVGTCVLIDDGDISLKVIEVLKDSLLCKVENGGIIKLRKSVNFPGIKLELPSITQKDKEFIDFAVEHEIDFIAHSFVQSANDIFEIRTQLDVKKSPIKIIAKIENQIGVDNIDEILNEADGIMVARGDLGIEIAAEKIPGIQHQLVRKCIRMKKPVIIATQMLHSMIQNPRPTRAEISDIAAAIYERADAIMLSGETAFGPYPVEAVNVMTRVANEVEQQLDHLPFSNVTPEEDSILATLAHSAVLACQSHDIKAIITDTLGGRTGRYLSAYRGNSPVFAMCFYPHIMRQLALSYGIEAYLIKRQNSRDGFMDEAIQMIAKKGYLSPDDLVVVLGGSFGPANGASFIEIAQVKNLLG